MALSEFTGYALFDPIAALIVGLMVAKMGSSFMWDSLHDLMDRAADSETEEKIKKTLQSTQACGIHDLNRKMGDSSVRCAPEIDGNWPSERDMILQSQLERPY